MEWEKIVVNDEIDNSLISKTNGSYNATITKTPTTQLRSYGPKI